MRIVLDAREVPARKKTRDARRGYSALTKLACGCVRSGELITNL
jgi:hypothetical protein